MELVQVDPRQYEPLYGKQGLIDGDIIAYRCAFAAEKTFYLIEPIDQGYSSFQKYEAHKDIPKDTPKENIWSRRVVSPVEFALQATKTTLEAILEKSRASGFRIYLSGKINFRDTVAVTRRYKAGRESIAKPTHWRAVRDYLVRQWKAVEVEGYEADDAIGISSTNDADSGEAAKGTFVCTIDKDLDQLPGLHYNWVQDKVYDISRRTADFNLYSQILSGDSTDNIPGIDGIGPAKAGTILEGCTSTMDLFQKGWDFYKQRGHTWDYFVEQARLIYILRANPNDDFLSRKEVPDAPPT